MSYEDIGYDKLLRRSSSRVSLDTTTGFESAFPNVPISTLRGDLTQDQMAENIGGLVNMTGITEATSGSVGDGQAVTLTSTVSDKLNKERLLIAIPEVVAYQDTVSSTTAIPYGSSLNTDDYFVTSYFDLFRNVNSSSPNAGVTYIHRILNQSGGTHTIIFHIRWRFIGRKSVA